MIRALTHHPFYYKTSQLPVDERPPFADQWITMMTSIQQILTRARPDLLVMIGSDHFHQLVVGQHAAVPGRQGPWFDANWYNEEREFGLPRLKLRGRKSSPRISCEKAWTPISTWRSPTSCGIDHSITCPIIALRPDADLPIVPIYTNIFAPPLPQPKRFVQLGKAVRELVESWDERPTGRDHRHRAPVPGTGWPTPVRRDTDRTRTSTGKRWTRIAGGDIDGCLAEVTLDSPAETRGTQPMGSWTSC